MSGGLRRRLAIVAVTVVGVVGASAGAAAAAGFQLTVSPRHIAQGGTVTISTTPRMACTLTVTIAKKPFSHAMKFGYLKIAFPRKDGVGRIPVRVTCAGTTEYSAFTVG